LSYATGAGCTSTQQETVQRSAENVSCISGMTLTPSHTGGSKLHENPLLDSILHTQVFLQTNDCSDQKQLSLHLPHVGTVENKSEWHHVRFQVLVMALMKMTAF
jgi:hypothetical protein